VYVGCGLPVGQLARKHHSSQYVCIYDSEYHGPTNCSIVSDKSLLRVIQNGAIVWINHGKAKQIVIDVFRPTHQFQTLG
jgi:hypothetical protein